MNEMSAKPYIWTNAECGGAHTYLLHKLDKLIEAVPLSNGQKTIFEVGCGNGSVASWLAQKGWKVSGVDSSEDGIAQARKAYPDLDVRLGSAYDPLASIYGRFPVVLSLEVVEHLFDPRTFAKNCFDLVLPGGMAIISTPFHGYFKNLAIAVVGKSDSHFTALWDGGHIKFWSEKTLRNLLEEAGFVHIEFHRVGRLSLLAKSMIAVAKRPLT
jgi:2-polyprenyl-3-methyl-5-hydroxy-6-metoxy-1,4-benzoquinol methylase